MTTDDEKLAARTPSWICVPHVACAWDVGGNGMRGSIGRVLYRRRRAPVGFFFSTNFA